MPGRGPSRLSAATPEADVFHFPVRASTAEAEDFAKALGLPETYGSAPLTFPIRWLGLPELRREITRRIGGQGGLLVQQSQSFMFADVLGVERDYRLAATVRTDTGFPGRLTLAATLYGNGRSEPNPPPAEEGQVVLAMETALRLLERAPAAAPVARGLPSAEPEIPELRLGPIGPQQVERYVAAAGDDNPVHTDVGAARAAGLPGPIVPGMFIVGQFERALVTWRRDLSLTRLYATFLQPLFVGRAIAIAVRIVRSRHASNHQQLTLRLTVRSDRDEPVCLGEVEAAAPL